MSYLTNRATATRLINKKGRTVTLSNKVVTTPDPAEPWNKTPGTDVTEDTKAVIMKYELKEIDGELVKVGDMKALVPYIEGVDVKNFDTLIDGSETWKIKKVTPVQPGDTLIFYRLNLRK